VKTSDHHTTKIGEHLIAAGAIDENKLNQALELQKEKQNQGKRLGQILLEKGWITDHQLTATLAKIYQLPIVKLENMEFDKSVLKALPYTLIKEIHVVPISLEGNLLKIAISDPLDLTSLQKLRNSSSYEIQLAIASLTEIKSAIDRTFSPFNSTQQELTKVNKKEPRDTLTFDKAEAFAGDAPVVRLVKSVIEEAIKERASDIHLEPRQDDVRVRFRIDSILYEKVVVPKHMQSEIISRIKIISGMDISETRKPQDGGMYAKGDNNKEYDIRVSTLPDIYGEKVVLRLLDKTSVIYPLDVIGMPPEEIAIIRSLIFSSYGIILLTGPTGSGKTTTLYSMLNMLNDSTRNIVTVEDPVEYEINGINQTRINVKAGYTFATAIRHILRQDPDIIMIGEIRDQETAEIAIQAALTGHLVLSTLHTNSAAGAITRLINMNIEPFLLSSAIIGIIAQRLMRKVCPHCKKEYTPTPETLASLNDPTIMTPGITLVKGEGCNKCHNLGYHGRTGIFEILTMNEEISNLTLKRASEREINAAALKTGMCTLRQSALKKALAKLTTADEVMRVSAMVKDYL